MYCTWIAIQADLGESVRCHKQEHYHIPTISDDRDIATSKHGQLNYRAGKEEKVGDFGSGMLACTVVTFKLSDRGGDALVDH
ncbi:hypothetical protein N7466_001709 [Penicillium verhagenii]|uniref:uncharacterized protein n=1 Tax=Penicillium verhagenii TaxID=1562060 RepID=UPI0025459D51|nr:uncharacterized protein N7466_001709 [Penicillium verhagenii]KAJ5938575.1 hypothetical protein N7466_001709 [Penicillium verhagenii]